MRRGLYEHTNWEEGLQRILNDHPVPVRKQQIDAPTPIPVRARIEWDTDGEEWIETTADAWAGQLVLVVISDARAWIKGAWLNAADIKRR